MLIDIASIRDKNAVGKINISERKLISIDDYSSMVLLTGAIVNKDGFFEFNGFIEGEIFTYCARCLKELSFSYKQQISQFFRHGLKQGMPEALLGEASLYLPDEDEILVFYGSYVDLEPVVVGIIRGDMPIAVKCSDLCKGLCPICGVDLNELTCNCKAGYVNPVFEKLNELLFNKSTE